MPGGDGTGPYGQGGMGRRRGTGGDINRPGPVGECLCPNCGHREPHQRAVPCFNRKCPKCGTPMTRT